MKQYLILIVLLLCKLQLSAQEFAPVGAEWFYNANKGIFRATVKEEKVKNGITCRTVSFVPFIDSAWKSYGFHLDSRVVYDIYNNEDTVFVYNILFSKFTPLYVFNVQQGDTVTLPLLLPNNGCASFTSNWGDSTFSYVVDSVKDVLYDTASLKTVFTHSLQINGKQEMSFGSYAKTIGRLDGGLLPDCISCPFIHSEHCEGAYDMRCYHDTNTSIKLVPDDCAKNIYLGVPAASHNAMKMELFPNPATNKIEVRFAASLNSFTAHLQTIDGRIISTATAQNTQSVSFDLSQLKPGLYFITLGDLQGHHYATKFIKQQD